MTACAHPKCRRDIEVTEPHVRQARLDAAGLPRRGEFDSFHLECHFEIGKVGFVEREPDPDVLPAGQEALPL